ncbi:MAG TPA: hypothetical protein VFI18_12120 [Gaiellales bacterium]|nr:hypothetical protein [Gaiellales bacterium]
MKPAELERLLELADRVETLERRLVRAETLTGELARHEELVAAAPEVGAAMERAGVALRPITRQLEREWVDQGPLVTDWQRAFELEQIAEAAGADPSLSAQEADAARRRVESARLATRRQRELIDREREAMTEAVDRSPFDVEIPAGGADARPEAARREALALAGVAQEAAGDVAEAGSAAAARAADARAELGRLGEPAALRRELEELRARLPGEVKLGEDAPASAAVKLERAGVRVR